MSGRKSGRVFNPVAKSASLKSSGPRSAMAQHRLLVTAAYEVEKKAHKRNPFKQEYVELCLSAFPQTAEEEEGLEEEEGRADAGLPDLAKSCCLVNDAAANIHVRTELIRTMKVALVKQTAEAAKQCECKAIKRAKIRHQKAAMTNNEPMQDTGAFFQPELLETYERILAGGAPAVLAADEARQNPNLREQDQLSLGPEALKQPKSVCDFIDGLFADGNPLTKGIEDVGPDEVVDSQQTAVVVSAILNMSPDTTFKDMECSQESDWAALESGSSCIASLLSGSKILLPPYLCDGPQLLADQLDSIAKPGQKPSQCQELGEQLDASHGKGTLKLPDGMPESGTQQTQKSPERGQQSRQPHLEEASSASLSNCNVASSAALDAAPMGRSSPAAHAASRPAGRKPPAKHAREVGVHSSAFLGSVDGQEELLQSGICMQQRLQPPATSNGRSRPDQFGVLDIDFVPDSDPDSSTSVSQAAVGGEVADVHNGRKLGPPVLRRRRHMGSDLAARAPTPAQEHLTSGCEAVEESSDEADDPPNAGVDPAIRPEVVSKRKVPVLARRKFAALPITATAPEDDSDGTEGAGAGQRAPEDSAAARIITSKKSAPVEAMGEHWQSETITPDFSPASLLALLPSALLRARPGQKPRYRPVHDPEALLLKLPAMPRQPAKKMSPHQHKPEQDSSPPGAPRQMLAAPMSQNAAGTPTQLPVKQEQPFMLQADHSAAGAISLETTRKRLANTLEAGTGVFALEDDENGAGMPMQLPAKQKQPLMLQTDQSAAGACSLESMRKRLANDSEAVTGVFALEDDENGAGMPTQLPVKQEQPLMLQADHSAAGAISLETMRKPLANDLEAGAGVFPLEDDENGAGRPTQLPAKQEQPLMLQTDQSAANAISLESTQKRLANELEAGTGVFAPKEDGDDLLPIVFDDGGAENTERRMAIPLHCPPDSLAQPVSLQHAAHLPQNAAQQRRPGSGKSVANPFQSQGVFAEATRAPSDRAQSAAECWWDAGMGSAGVQFTSIYQQREANKIGSLLLGQGLRNCSLVFMDQQPGSLQLPCRSSDQPPQPPLRCSYNAAGCSAQSAPGTLGEEQSSPTVQEPAQLSRPPSDDDRSPEAEGQAAQRLVELDCHCPIVFFEDEPQSLQQGEPLINPAPSPASDRRSAPKSEEHAVLGLVGSRGQISPAKVDAEPSNGHQPTITRCHQRAESEREAAEPQWGPLQPRRPAQRAGRTKSGREADPQSPAASMSVTLSYLDRAPHERLPPTACMTSSDAGTMEIEGVAQECVITFPETASSSQNCNAQHSHTQNLEQQLLVNSPPISNFSKTTAREQPQWECRIVHAQDSQPETAQPSRCAGPAGSLKIQNVGSDALPQLAFSKQPPREELPAAAGDVEGAVQGQAASHDYETGQQINGRLPTSLGATEGSAANAERRRTDGGDIGMRGASEPPASASAEPPENSTAATCDLATVSPARRAQATAPDLHDATALRAAGQITHSQIKGAATGRRKRSKEELYDFYMKEALGENSVRTRLDALTGMVMARLESFCTSAAPVTLSELMRSGQSQTMSGSDALPQRYLMALLSVVHRHNTGQQPLSSGRQQQLRLVASLNHADCCVEVNGSEDGVDHLRTDAGLTLHAQCAEHKTLSK